MTDKKRVKIVRDIWRHRIGAFAPSKISKGEIAEIVDSHDDDKWYRVELVRDGSLYWVKPDEIKR